MEWYNHTCFLMDNSRSKMVQSSGVEKKKIVAGK